MRGSAKILGWLTVICIIQVAPAWADMQAGGEAYKRGDFVEAFEELMPLADAGSAELQEIEIRVGVDQRRDVVLVRGVEAAIAFSDVLPEQSVGADDCRGLAEKPIMEFLMQMASGKRVIDDQQVIANGIELVDITPRPTCPRIGHGRQLLIEDPVS